MVWQVVVIIAETVAALLVEEEVKRLALHIISALTDEIWTLVY